MEDGVHVIFETYENTVTKEILKPIRELLIIRIILSNHHHPRKQSRNTNSTLHSHLSSATSIRCYTRRCRRRRCSNATRASSRGRGGVAVRCWNGTGRAIGHLHEIGAGQAGGVGGVDDDGFVAEVVGGGWVGGEKELGVGCLEGWGCDVAVLALSGGVSVW